MLLLEYVDKKWEPSESARVWNPGNVPGYESIGFVKKTRLNSEGAYLMVRPCRAWMFFLAEDSVYRHAKLRFDMREAILDFYGLQNLREERFNQVADALRNDNLFAVMEDGIIKLKKEI